MAALLLATHQFYIRGGVTQTLGPGFAFLVVYQMIFLLWLAAGAVALVELGLAAKIGIHSQLSTALAAFPLVFVFALVPQVVDEKRIK
jgi:hypothetical protein